METYRVIEFADAYGIEILTARRFTDEEKTRFAGWYRELGMYGVEGPRVDLAYLTIFDMPQRTPDTSFPGCTNRGWIISDEEERAFVALNAARAEAEARKDQEKNQAVESAFRAARSTGKPQKLRSYVSERCLEALDDCSFDHVTEFALPNGGTSKTSTHCY
jgi:hypothetical protein